MKPCLSMLAAAILPLVLCSAPVTPERAVDFASDFMSRHAAQPARSPRKARHGMRPESSPSGNTRTCSENGTNLFHLVALDGGGFVAVSADDSAYPVLGFSGSGSLPDADERNPFWSLLGAHADAAAKRGGTQRHGNHRRMTFTDSRVARPRRLLSTATSSRKSASYSSVDDIRVAPLVKSKWDQGTVGSKKVYNYYTPNGYLCGCVATAMAQLMRFHEFPKSSVAQKTFTCHVGANETQTNITMKGGVYAWSSMPLVPSYSISEVEREMIGRICFDVGVSVRMAYGLNGKESGAIGAFAHDPLKNVFAYANAESYLATNESLTDSEIKTTILANLDAKHPVLLGIGTIGKEGGHAIIADGYGYIGETLYCHLNMGWSGSQDYWYAIPDIGTSYGFNAIDSVVYNIFPDKTGQLVTGRVTDPFGNPMEGVDVNASFKKPKDIRTIKGSTTTDENGIYALFAPAGAGCTATISVTHSGWTSKSASTSTQASRSPFNINWETGNSSAAQNGLVIGNSWGNDFVAGSTNGAKATLAALAPSQEGSATRSGLSISISATPGAWYQVERTYDLANPQWEAVDSFMVPSTGAASVDMPINGADSAFYRVVPK